MDEAVGLIVVVAFIALVAIFFRLRKQLFRREQQGGQHGTVSSRSGGGVVEKEIATAIKRVLNGTNEAAIKRAMDVVTAYGSFLEKGGARDTAGPLFRPESKLPYPKTEIRESIERLLVVEQDEAKRNALEVGDVALNDFVHDRDYQVIRCEMDAMSRSVKLFNAGEKDSLKLAKMVVEGSTSEADALLKQLHDQQTKENKDTLERHKALRLIVASAHLHNGA